MPQHALFVCTDTHGRMPVWDPTGIPVSACLHGGDFYDKRLGTVPGAAGMAARRGHRARKVALDRAVADARFPIFAVRGNHDVDDPWGFFEACDDVTGRVVELAPGLLLAGIGWHGERFSDLPEESDLERVCDAIRPQLADRLAPGDRLVILSHYPVPTDLSPGHACLARLLAELRPAVFLQGHWHQAFGKQTTLPWPDGSATLVVNPGPRGGLVTLDAETGAARFELV